VKQVKAFWGRWRTHEWDWTVRKQRKSTMVFVQVIFCCPFLYCGTALVDFVTMIAWIFSFGLCGSRCNCGGIQKRWCRTNFESNVTNDEESGYARVQKSLKFLFSRHTAITSFSQAYGEWHETSCCEVPDFDV